MVTNWWAGVHVVVRCKDARPRLVPAGLRRGTTLLARASPGRSMTAVTGLPVRVYWGRLRGGSAPHLLGLFFRKLTGDGRVRALAQKCIAQAVSRVISGIMEIELLPETFVTEAVLLVCAFILSAVIGVEREVRQ